MFRITPHILNAVLLPAPDAASGDLFWDALLPASRDALSAWRPFLTRIAASSPYLRLLMEHEQALLRSCLDEQPAALLAGIHDEISAARAPHSRSEMMHGLRLAKRRAALVIALADIAEAWQVDDVVEALTRIADAMVGATVAWLLREAHGTGKLTHGDAEGSGYTVLAMGKHGARELNYSSDVDLIVLYDPEIAPVLPGVEPSTFFVRLTKNLVSMLQDVTEDGYALRVDLRLRPDPRATQVAIAMEAAAVYYENQGQNWERAAMIKARPVAGDLALGQEFLARLRPYIWRKYLDFAAIADVQSLKRQIHAVKGHGEIAVLGHNVKLGRGGIREIEFFVQTQQLIAGGRNASLRGLRTLDMLAKLVQAQWITAQAARELAEAYRFLRSVEHRLQMVADEQTHTLPATAIGFAAFSAFMGQEHQALWDRLRGTFETVQGHYAALFESADDLGHAQGNLVFTGGEDDPGTIETLSQMGFKQASEVSATIRGWHFGRYAAMRSARSRELMTELVPKILAALARTGDADQAFIAFDKFLAGLPAGVQLLSMLQATPSLLDLIATILGSAPRMAEQISARPRVLEAVLEPGFFGALPLADEFQATARKLLEPDLPLEELADRARTLGREQGFRIGVRVLSDTLSAIEAGRAFSDLAQALLRPLHEAVTRDIALKHGGIDGGASCVIAMGKLGGREMTANSDLDLMVIYDQAGEQSYGPRPLSAGQYFSRLTQRLITLVNAPTAEGKLYDVDMRLRPSGSQGPVATSLASFATYQRESAWTWEKLALTRARVVAGNDELAEKVTAAIAQALREPRDAAATRKDVRDMRALMLREQKAQGVWDIKRARGGLVEVEFIAQFLQIVHAFEAPQALSTNTLESLERLASAGDLDASHAADLRAACRLYHRLTQVLRLCVSDGFDPQTAPPGLKGLVARAAEMPDIASAEALVAETQARVAAIFDEIIGSPAATESTKAAV